MAHLHVLGRRALHPAVLHADAAQARAGQLGKSERLHSKEGRAQQQEYGKLPIHGARQSRRELARHSSSPTGWHLDVDVVGLALGAGIGYLDHHRQRLARGVGLAHTCGGVGSGWGVAGGVRAGLRARRPGGGLLQLLLRRRRRGGRRAALWLLPTTVPLGT